MKEMKALSCYLTEYIERNNNNAYKPVAVGRYGIRLREDIYSKELAQDYSKNKLIYNNTLTVGMGSVQIDIGILTDEIIYSVSPAYHTYRINGINADYLRYCLECRNADMFARYVKRGSRQGKSIDLKRWLTYEIPVYDSEKQQDIVERLDFIINLINKRKTQLQKLDDLVKSQFIEMFGDLRSNPKQWTIAQFNDFAKIDCNMTTDYEKYADYPHIGIDCIEKETGEIKDYHTIKEDGVISGKYIFTPEHIIYSKIRPNLNKVALPNFTGLCSADAYPILPIKEKCDRIFLAIAMRSSYFLDYILQFSARTNLPKVNRNEIMGFKMPLPPLPLQTEFARFVEQTDKSKFRIKQSLEKLETCYKALLQKYFG